jgi:hypothetical protein
VEPQRKAAHDKRERGREGGRERERERERERDRERERETGDLPVVVSGAFINFLLHNHSIKKKSFSGDVNYEANFAFFFNFIRELNIYSPLVSISQIIN